MPEYLYVLKLYVFLMVRNVEFAAYLLYNLNINLNQHVCHVPGVLSAGVQMRNAEITLSAMTSRIRRNWIDILQKRFRTIESFDNTRYRALSQYHSYLERVMARGVYSRCSGVHL